MKSLTASILLIIFPLNGSYIQSGSQNSGKEKERLELLKSEVSDNLTKNILPYWSVRMPDKVNGGFYGRIDRNESVHPDAEKGGILNARILWTFSSAYRVLGDSSYLKIATDAKDYILAHFIDHRFGGVYRSLNADGTPKDTRKQLYTNAFFIYGLSEYSRATGNKEALEEAMKIFRLFEQFGTDKEFNGYFEVFSRDWQRLRERLIGESSNKDEKTMNTHLHIMEAYANLFRVSGDKLVEDRLKNLINIFLDKIIDKKTYHLKCFLDRRWTSTSNIDSYGHDIECSWLLYEAATITGEQELIDRAKEVSVRIADAATEGYQADGSMLSERDYITGHFSKSISWWEQAETIVGYINAYELTGNESYLKKSINCWSYVKKHLVDYKNGSWFTTVSKEGIPGGDKAGFWICPYHNGRMCMEIIERVGNNQH